MSQADAPQARPAGDMREHARRADTGPLLSPAEISADIARLASRAEVVAPRKGEQHKVDAIRRAGQFLLAHSR
jgi:hypothetical protein